MLDADRCADSRTRHRTVRGAPRAPLRAGRPPRRPTPTLSRAAAAAHRRLLHQRVLGRGGGAVQSVDRARARSGRACARGEQTVRHEPARGRRGPHLVDRVPDRRRSTAPATMTFDPLADRAWSPAIARRPPTTTRPQFAPSSSSSARATSSPGRCSIGCRSASRSPSSSSRSPALERDGPPHAISFETVEDHPRARGVELRHHLPRRFGAVRAGDLPRRAARDPRHGGRALRPLRRRRRQRRRYYATYTAFDGFEIMPQLIETDDFVSFRDLDAQRLGGAEQGHGAVPAADRRAST